jgi:hypothetical protein
MALPANKEETKEDAQIEERIMNINQISKMMNDTKTAKKITTPKITKRPVTSSNRLSKPSNRVSTGIEIKEKP